MAYQSMLTFKHTSASMAPPSAPVPSASTTSASVAVAPTPTSVTQTPIATPVRSPHASSSALEGVVEGSAAGSITGANPQPRPTRAPELLIDPQPRPTSARPRPTRAPAPIEDADSDTDSFDLEAELDRLSSWSAGSESDHEVPSASESDDAVTHVRHNPAWRIRCEEGYGADKPSQMLRVHLACAGIDAPGRAMTEYGVSQPSCTNYICSRYWRLTRRNTCKQFKKRSKCTPPKLIQSIINATEIKKH
jgi:hypothetical protein